MVEPKAFASLTSSLLARKGGARPAMRRQATMGEQAQDDLGWNDMGEGQEHQSDPMAVAGLTPMPSMPVTTPRTAEVEAMSAQSAPVPVVVEQRRALARKIETPIVPATVTAMGPRKAKAAFTLRLDPDRHLRLRLACAVGNRSAQQIVTEALDVFLNSQPDIEVLAVQVPRDGVDQN